MAINPKPIAGPAGYFYLIAAVGACTAEPVPSLHPDRQFLAYPVEVGFARVAWDSDTSLVPLARGIAIGDSAGPADSMFAKIVDVRLDAAGRLITLDAQLARLRLYSTDGRLIAQVGRPGPGPEEFSQPLSLGLAEDGILVGSLDRTVKLFTPTDTALVLKKVFHVRGAARALCAIGRRLYVNGPTMDSASVVVEYDLDDGGKVKDFGPAYRSRNALLNLQLNEAKLLCHTASGIVVAAMGGGIAELRAFDSTGATKWITKLDPFRGNKITETNGGYQVEIPDGGSDRFFSIMTLDSTRIVVQVAYLTKADAIAQSHYTRVASLVVDVRTGKELATGVLPPLHAIHGSVAVGYRDEPFPRAEVWRATRH